MILEDNRKLEKFFGSVYVNFVVLFVFVLRFIQHGIAQCTVLKMDWQGAELTLNYSYGFIKRAFLGSIVRFMANTIGMGYEKAIIVFMDLEELLFIFVFFGFILYVINKYKNVYLNMLIVFLLSTDIVGFYFFDWGEPDVVQMSLVILICTLIVKDKFIWAVPVLSLVCVLIHEGYSMMYFGLVAGLLLVSCIQNKSIRIFAVLLTTGITSAALTLYLYVFSKEVIVLTPREVVDNAIAIFGDELFGCYMLYYNIWNGGEWLFTDGLPNEAFWARVLGDSVAVVICFALIRFKYRFWKTVIKNENDKLKKFGYLCCSLVFLLMLPLVIIHCDHGRWFYSIVFEEFMLVIFLYLMGDSNVKETLPKVIRPCVGNVILMVFLFGILSLPNKQFISDLFVIPWVLITGGMPYQ